MSFVALLDPAPADVQLYTFLVRQIAASIRRADADRGPAAAGWGHADLRGLTENRSIEAHLADHGIHEAYGTGSAEQDPDGPAHTIDPAVDVLRVDKLGRRRGRTVHVPIGAWSNFADHGTVVKSELQAYSGDHHAAAWRVFTALCARRAACRPCGRWSTSIPTPTRGIRRRASGTTGRRAPTRSGRRRRKRCSGPGGAPAQG